MRKLATASPEVRAYLANVDGVVEANSFEQHALWRLNDAGLDGKKLAWEERNSGFIAQTGTFGDNLPSPVSLFTVKIDGFLLLFYYGSGTYVDNDLIEQWLEATLPEGAWNNRTDAMNFHNVINDLRRQRERKLAA